MLITTLTWAGVSLGLALLAAWIVQVRHYVLGF
jgi:hypothetical protein